jgi:restriction system protein
MQKSYLPALKGRARGAGRFKRAHEAAQYAIWVRSHEKPKLLLQAVIDTGGRTFDGDIIVAVQPAWDEIIKKLEEDPSLVYQCDPRRWEEIIAASYKRAGYDEVVLTPRSGDFGRDVIAVKHGFGSVRLIESVKRYAPTNLVTADDVRALMGVLSSDRNASKGVISTTSDFAPKLADDPFIKPLLPHRIELVNGEQLLVRLQQHARGS